MRRVAQLWRGLARVAASPATCRWPSGVRLLSVDGVAPAAELPASAWPNGTVAVPEFKRVRAMKDAHGRQVVDPRTVAFLVAKGVGSTSEVYRLLQTSGNGRHLFNFERCLAAYTVLERLVGGSGATKRRYGRVVPLACSIVHRYPAILRHSAASLEQRWRELQTPRDAGGVGLSASQAHRVLSHRPSVVGNKLESMLARLEWLESIGVRNGSGAFGASPTLIGLAFPTMHAKVDILRCYGLNVGVAMRLTPGILCLSVTTMTAKLDLLLHVLQLSPSDVSSSSILLALDTRGRMRTRVFLLAQLAGGELPSSRVMLLCMKQTDAAMVKRLQRASAPAHLCTVAGFRAHVSSPEFVAYADAMEARLVEESQQRRAAAQQRVEATQAAADGSAAAR